MITTVRAARDRASLALDPLGHTRARRRDPLPLREAARRRVEFERECWPALRDDLINHRRDLADLARYTRWQAADRMFSVASVAANAADEVAKLTGWAFWRARDAERAARLAWERGLAERPHRGAVGLFTGGPLTHLTEDAPR